MEGQFRSSKAELLGVNLAFAKAILSSASDVAAGYVKLDWPLTRGWEGRQGAHHNCICLTKFLKAKVVGQQQRNPLILRER